MEIFAHLLIALRKLKLNYYITMFKMKTSIFLSIKPFTVHIYMIMIEASAFMHIMLKILEGTLKSSIMSLFNAQTGLMVRFLATKKGDALK
jgi:hypothetical protein